MNDTARHIVTIEIGKRKDDLKTQQTLKKSTEEHLNRTNIRIKQLESEIEGLEELL